MAFYNNPNPEVGRLDSFISSDKVNIRLNYGLKLHYAPYPESCWMYKTGSSDKTTSPFATSFELNIPNVKRIGAYISTNHLPVTPETTFYKNPFELYIKWIDEDDEIDGLAFDRNISCKNYIPDQFYGDYERFILVEWENLYYNVPLGVGNVQAIEYIFEIGIPVFETENELNDYLQTGDEGGSVNPSKEAEAKPRDRYIYCTGYESTQPLKASENKHKYFKHDLDIPYDGSAKGWNGTRPVAGWVRPNVTGDTKKFNIELIENDDIKYYDKLTENLYPSDFSRPEERNSLSECKNPAWLYTDAVYSDGYYYWGDLQTNIPLFDTRQKAIDYLHGLIDKDKALKPGGNDEGDNNTGEDVPDTGYNNVNGECIGSEVLVLNSSQTHAFFNFFFNPTGSIFDEIIDGLKMWGTNPVDFIVDYFAVPFDANTLSEVTNSSKVTFGTKAFDIGTSVTKLSKLAPKLIDCFSIYIDGGFNDWRDYASNYYLFLPYAGIKSLDINKYLYKTLSCKVSVDFRTGQIKYHLYADNIEMDTVETVCRVSMPMTTTNIYSNARERLNQLGGLVDDTVGAVFNPSINGIMKGSNDVLDLLTVPKASTSGACSPSNGWLDPSNCYLYIQTPEFRYNGITSGYNYPDNEFTTIGGHSGYLEATDIILSGCSDCSEHEKNIIKSLIKEGIIL